MSSAASPTGQAVGVVAVVDTSLGSHKRGTPPCSERHTSVEVCFRCVCREAQSVRSCHTTESREQPKCVVRAVVALHRVVRAAYAHGVRGGHIVCCLRSYSLVVGACNA